MFDEASADAYALRYGSIAPSALPDLGRFVNHRSVRAFSEEPVPEATVEGLFAAAQSAATSSNLQLWSAVSVQNSEARHEISMLCGDQNQIRQASWFFAFCADHYRLREAAKRVGEGAEGLPYAEFMLVAAIDAALAAERMVCAAESLGIGTCYIGALRNKPEEVSRVLNLPRGVFGLFGLCLGYPQSPMKAEIKPRLRSESIWFREHYDHAVSADEYDARMAAFYESQGMKGDATWSMRSGRRVDEHHMSGRETLREYLASQGFWVE
jgi:nitroreductase